MSLTSAVHPSPVCRLALGLLLVLTILGTALVPAAATAQSADFVPPVRPDDERALRIMTYNVRFASARDGHEDWPVRAVDMAAQLAQSDLDILGTQELKETANGGAYTQRADIANMLPGFAFVGRSRSADPDDEQMGVYYRQSRLAALEDGHFWLSPTPQEPGSFGYGNQGNARMVTWVRFVDRVTAAEFYLLNTHFDHASEDARYRAADQLAGYLTGDPAYADDGVSFDPALPMVLMGDFNFDRGQDTAAPLAVDPGAGPVDPIKARRPGGPVENQVTQFSPVLGNRSAYRRLVTAGPFVDTWETAVTRGPEVDGTFTGFAEIQDRWLDWILASDGVEVLRSYVDTYRPNGEWPSDHLPVVADVVIDESVAPPADDGVTVIGHRGASRYAPENTLPAIALAIELGAEQVEIDIQLSADAQIILLHDTTLGRTTDVAEAFAADPRVVAGDAPPQLFTADELATLDAGSWGRFAPGAEYDGAYAGTHVPTFAEVLELVRDHPEVGILIEVKQPETSPGIEAILARQLLAERNAGFANAHVVQSFSPESMVAYAAEQAAIGLDLPVGQLSFVSADAGQGFTALAAYADQFNPSAGGVTAEAVESAHAAGLTVNPYTVNDHCRMAELVALGVDGIITDVPDVLTRVLDPDDDTADLGPC